MNEDLTPQLDLDATMRDRTLEAPPLFQELGPGTAPRVLQWRYLFSAGATLPMDLIDAPRENPWGLTPVIVVATGGAVGDWAAYIAGVPVNTPAPEEADAQVLADVASWGYKLTEDQANGFFPYMTGRRYRA